MRTTDGTNLLGGTRNSTGNASVSTTHHNHFIGGEPVNIGIMPEWTWKEQRKKDLVEAIIRYLQANKKVPQEWIDEYNRFVA